VRRQLRSSHPVGCYLSGGLDSSSVAALAARALAESNQRLAAFTQVPRKGFAGPVPSGRYADERPYVEEIRAALGNIDVSYVHNDECDDFAELDRFFIAFEAPVRNQTHLGWMLAIPRLARAQGRRVLLSGQYGNFTISWSGWSQAIDHALRGHLFTAYRQWRLYYRRSPYSRAATLHKLFVEPLMAARLRAAKRTGGPPPWAAHSAIRADFAAAMGVEGRAKSAGHDFYYRLRRGERTESLARADYVGDWLAAQKAITGVEVRDPTADVDVLSYCFGIPPEQYLVEDIDRSLVRRAMWGLLPEAVLTNRMNGLQSADWYEKLEKQLPALAAEIAGLAASPLVRRAIDLDRLARAVNNWPRSGWETRAVIDEYNFALTRAVGGARFLRWVESANR
jgi:asparagine synthase (glutamine-hydrolysing)